MSVQLPLSTEISMSSLPLDIWYVVCSHFDLGELKALRFVSKDFNGACIPRLFHTLRLRPTFASLEQATAVAQTPDLASCVQKLALNEERVDISHTLYNFKSRIDSIWPSHRESNHVASQVIRDELLYRIYVSDLHKEHWGLDGYDEQAVVALISSLPSLRHITRSQSPMTENLIEYRETEKILTSVYKPRWLRDYETFSIDVVMQMGLMRTLRALELNPVHLQEFVPFASADATSPQAQQLFGNLAELKLVLYIDNESISHDATDPFLQGLQNFIITTSNIHTFSVRLLTPNPGRHRNLIESAISAMVLQQYHHRLNRVNFQRFACTEAEFLAFATNHAHTLRSLTLDSLTFLASSRSDQPHPSVLRLCWNLRKCLDLSHFCIRGQIRAAAREGWHVLPEKSAGASLSSQLCASVCHREDFPFTALRMSDDFYAFEPTEKDIEHVIMLINEGLPDSEIRLHFEDRSWRWMPGQIPD